MKQVKVFSFVLLCNSELPVFIYHYLEMCGCNQLLRPASLNEGAFLLQEWMQAGRKDCTVDKL